jgi:hypothetical protein
VALFFGRAGAGVVRGSGQIAGIGDRGTAHARGGVVEHSVGADKGLGPRLRADEARLENEGHRLGNQLVEVLDGHLDVLFFVHQDSVAVGGVLAQGGEPVAQAAFSGEEAVLKAESPGIVGVARFVEVIEGLRAVPPVGDLPAKEEEDGDRVEGGPTAGRGPPQALSQDRAQGGEVDQAQEQVERLGLWPNHRVGEMFPGGWVLEIMQPR